MTASSASSLIPKIDFMVVSSRNFRAVGESCASLRALFVRASMGASFFWSVCWTKEVSAPTRASCAPGPKNRNPGSEFSGPGSKRRRDRRAQGQLRINCSAREDTIQLLFDLYFLGFGGDRDLLDQERARGVEHLALAEGELFVPLEALQIAQDLGDLEDRPGLDLLHVLAVAAVPGLSLDGHFAALENLEHLVDLVGANELAQTDRARIARGNHDLHPILENLENVEGLLVARDLARLDADNLRNAVGRIDGQITHSESRLHDYVRSLLRTVFNAGELYHANTHNSTLLRRRRMPRRACQIAVRSRCGAGN